MDGGVGMHTNILPCLKFEVGSPSPPAHHVTFPSSTHSSNQRRHSSFLGSLN